MAIMPTLLTVLAPLCLLQSVEYRSPAGVEYRAQHDTASLVYLCVCVLSGVGLAVYGAKFQRKARRL